MANTTNFGWETPDDTDLVKDGASAMRTLGNAIDTSLVDLKGGTTGQVLSKASNTDLDFTWSSVDPLTILDAKGDLISATAADSPARLAVGANDTVLTADSSTATGLKWATVSAGGMTLISTTTLSGATTTISSIPTTYYRLIAFIYGVNPSNNSQQLTCWPNGGGAANMLINESTLLNSVSNSYIRISPDTGGGWGMKSGNTNNYFTLIIDNYASSTNRKGHITYGAFVEDDTIERASFGAGGIGTNSQITSLLFQMSAGTFNGGTIQLYGVK